MKEKLSELEIDQLVEAEADDDSAWEEPIQVRKTESVSLSIPSELTARAAFLAKLHNEKGYREWLTRIIRERIELEESAYAEVKREIKEQKVKWEE